MKKPQISVISKNYSQALFETARESNSSELFLIQLNQIKEVIKSSNDLKIVMNNSSVVNSKKIEILEDIFKNKIDEKLLNFLKILIEKKHFSELESIYYSYKEIAELNSNKKNIEIISSIDLDEKIRIKILEKLQKKLSCEVIPNWIKDESIIAGLVFKIEDYVIDASVANKLDKLSRNILR